MMPVSLSPEMPRRNWNIYNSLIGTFYRGTPKGLVSIRYSDGSVYEGRSFDWAILLFDSRSYYYLTHSILIFDTHLYIRTLLPFDWATSHIGPYLNEMWLNDIGQVRPEGRERNHFGMYTCADGRTFEGHNVDNHFDCMNLQVRYLIRAPYFDCLNLQARCLNLTHAPYF